jgi:hypothetical protein
MPQPIPGQGATGIVPPSQLNQFPQWGVGGGSPGSAAGWNVQEAHNALEKQSLIQQGYLVWFTSEADAKAFISEESSTFGSGNVPGLTGLAAIGDFFARLTEANTWLRVGEFVAGGLILYVGLKAIVTPEGQNVGRRTLAHTAKTTAKVLGTVVGA